MFSPTNWVHACSVRIARLSMGGALFLIGFVSVCAQRRRSWHERPSHHSGTNLLSVGPLGRFPPEDSA